MNPNNMSEKEIKAAEKARQEHRRANPRNSHDQVGRGGVYIHHVAREGRTPFPSRWQVIRPGYKTDPNASWYDHGRKTFTHSGGDSKKAAFAEAQAWAGNRYGIKNWKRNGVGDYINADASFAPIKRSSSKKEGR